MNDLSLDHLDTKAAAQWLCDHGYPLKASTLLAFRVRGGGPPHYRWANRVFYLAPDLLVWAEGRAERIEPQPERPERRRYRRRITEQDSSVSRASAE